MNEKPSIATIARTVALALALVNQVLSATGHAVLPIESEQVESIVTTGITIVASIVAWWKNNSFTANAIAADETLKNLKALK